MSGCKETQCTRCIHREVCIFKMDFLTAQEHVDKLEYEHAKGGTVCLSNIPFIYPVELKCRYYYTESETARSNCGSATSISTANYPYTYTSGIL